MNNTLATAIAAAWTTHARVSADPMYAGKVRDAWAARMRELSDLLPHGSGLDGAVTVESATDTRIVIACEFHHMNGDGYYCGWTAHKIIVTAGFSGIDVRVTGRDRNGIKDYLADVFYAALTETAPPLDWGKLRVAA